MSKITPALFIAALLVAGVYAPPVEAQLARTFVSSAGNDMNDCNRLTPCRTFQHAHDITLAKGEITVLDPGGYGAVTINKAISIIDDGVGEAGVLVSGNLAGITIAAGAGDTVSLRGLTIKGIGFGGGTGIVFVSGAALLVENCVIRNLDGVQGNGVLFQPSATAAITVANSTITDNTANGLLVAPTMSPVIRVLLDHVSLYGNGFAGLNVSGSSSSGGIGVQVVDSLAANNGTFPNGGGFVVQSTAGHALTGMWLMRSVASNNFNSGIVAFGPNATIEVSQSLITNNLSGWLAASGGTIRSYGDNIVTGNGADEASKPLASKL